MIVGLFRLTPDVQELDDKRQAIVKAAVLTAVAGTTAALYIRNTMTACEMFLALCATYKGADTKQHTAERALDELQALKFENRGTCSAEGICFQILFVAETSRR